jgi:hypothetical protein
LVVQGYPGQFILLENARWMEVGREIHASLDPPVSIRVPTLSAYVLVKGLSSETRTNPAGRAKDLVYLLEIVRHPLLGREAIDGMGGLAAWYPAEYHRWRAYLGMVAGDRMLLAAIVDQLIAGAGPVGLCTALTLAGFGVPSLVLEAEAERGAGYFRETGSKAICFQRDVLDVFDRLGVAAPLVAEGTTWTTARTYYREHEVRTVTFPGGGSRTTSELPPWINIS